MSTVLVSQVESHRDYRMTYFAFLRCYPTANDLKRYFILCELSLVRDLVQVCWETIYLDPCKKLVVRELVCRHEGQVKDCSTCVDGIWSNKDVITGRPAPSPPTPLRLWAVSTSNGSVFREAQSLTIFEQRSRMFS